MRSLGAEGEAGAVWRRRAKPCFGTRLVVSVRGSVNLAAADLAINRAFVMAHAFHAAMSRQSRDSDIAAIGRARPGETVAIGDTTRAVIRLALEIAEDTGGLFDPVVRGSAGGAQCWRDVVVVAGGVRVRRPLELSLDGVAKGYAADRLCTDLREAGMAEVIVDAGGDLALACEGPHRIGVRDPVRPDAVVRVVELASGGVATSAAYGGISELWGRRGGVRWPGSVSVIAPSCAVADAFTKVAALDPDAEALFARWGARALLLSRKDAA